MLSTDAKTHILAHLSSEEGFRQYAYDDSTGETVKAPKGNLTIGIGWNIQTNGCPRDLAEYVAMYYVNKADEQLSQKIPFYTNLDDPTKVALCDMAFNMGVAGVMGFTNMLDCLKRDDRVAAAIAILNSKWSKEVGKRAVIVSAMIEKKDWL